MLKNSAGVRQVEKSFGEPERIYFHADWLRDKKSLRVWLQNDVIMVQFVFLSFSCESFQTPWPEMNV